MTGTIFMNNSMHIYSVELEFTQILKIAQKFKFSPNFIPNGSYVHRKVRGLYIKI